MLSLGRLPCLFRRSLRTFTGFGGLVFIALAACENPGQPATPAATEPLSTPPIAPAVAGLQLIDLGSLGGGFAAAFGINERTEVVGDATVPAQTTRAFLWRANRGMRSLGTLGGNSSNGNNLNDQTEVVGFSQITPGSEVFHAFLWTPGNGMRDLGTLGGQNSAAVAINNRREVVGASDNPGGRPRAFLWVDGRGMRGLGTLGGSRSEATDVNDATQVVGFAQISGGSQAPVHAFLWTREGGMKDLGTLGGPNSMAHGISQTGEVVGASETATGTTEAFLWTPEQGIKGLGMLGTGNSSDARAINTHRRVVGNAAAAGGPEGLSAFLWRPEKVGLRALPSIGGGSSAAAYLNEFGEIAGFSTDPESIFHAVLWRPVVGPLATPSVEELSVLPNTAVIRLLPGSSRAAPCDSRQIVGDSPRFWTVTQRACLGH